MFLRRALARRFRPKLLAASFAEGRLSSYRRLSAPLTPRLRGTAA